MRGGRKHNHRRPLQHQGLLRVPQRLDAGQQLIEHGPYRLLRHPGYSGSLLLWLGAGLTTANAPRYSADCASTFDT